MVVVLDVGEVSHPPDTHGGLEGLGPSESDVAVTAVEMQTPLER